MNDLHKIKSTLNKYIKKHKLEIDKGKNINFNNDAIYTFKYLLNLADNNPKEVKKAMELIIISSLHSQFFDATYLPSVVIREIFPNAKILDNKTIADIYM